MLEVNVRALRERQPGSPALVRYTRVARLLTGREDAAIEDGVAWLRETAAELHVAPLGSVGLRTAQHAEVAEKAARSSSMRGNPIALSGDELREVLRLTDSISPG